MTASLDINALLADRTKVHGDFTDQAGIAQALKKVLRQSPRWVFTTPVEREAMEMIAHKLARAVCGDPHEPDHYADIAGYATLCANRCREWQSAPHEKEVERAVAAARLRPDGTNHPDVNFSTQNATMRGTDEIDVAKG